MPSAWCCACLAVLAVARARCGGEKRLLELLFVVLEHRYDARRPRKGAVDLLLASPSVSTGR